MNTKDYYASTAYNSHRARKNNKVSLIIKQPSKGCNNLKHKLLPNITFPDSCLIALNDEGDPYYFYNAKINQQMGIMSQEDEKERQLKHELIRWPSLNSPAKIVLKFNFALGFMLLIMLLSLVSVMFLPSFAFNYLLYYFAALLVIQFVLYQIRKYLLRIYPSIKYTVLNRRTGMVTVPNKETTNILPFNEFVPYVATHCSSAWGKYQNLWYIHRYTDCRIQIGVDKSWPLEMLLTHQYYQQFMDISKPLPDVPKLEDYRHLDPVTAEYDRKTGRPKDYWKSKTKEEIDKMLADIRKETKKIDELKFI